MDFASVTQSETSEAPGSLSTRILSPLTSVSLACRCSALRCASSGTVSTRSEEHTSELQSQFHLVCRLLLEKKKKENFERMAAQTHQTLMGSLALAHALYRQRLQWMARRQATRDNLFHYLQPAYYRTAILH